MILRKVAEKLHIGLSSPLLRRNPPLLLGAANVKYDDRLSNPSREDNRGLAED